MHAPSACRDIIRRLKRGEEPRTLLADAIRIPDDGWGALAMFHVSGSRDLMFDEAKAGLEEALARAKGCEVLDGSGMAVFQAVRAFKLFTGLDPDPARMRATFEAFQDPKN